MSALDPFVLPWTPKAVAPIWRALKAGVALEGYDKILGRVLEAYETDYADLWAHADDLGELELDAAFRGHIALPSWYTPFLTVFVIAHIVTLLEEEDPLVRETFDALQDGGLDDEAALKELVSVYLGVVRRLWAGSVIDPLQRRALFRVAMQQLAMGGSD